MPVRRGHFINKDPSNYTQGCYTQLSFDAHIVKRKSLSSETPLYGAFISRAHRLITERRGQWRTRKLHPQDQSGVCLIFIVFPQLGKLILGFRQHLGALATENQKVLDTSRTKVHKDNHRGLEPTGQLTIPDLGGCPQLNCTVLGH